MLFNFPTTQNNFRIQIQPENLETDQPLLFIEELSDDLEKKFIK